MKHRQNRKLAFLLISLFLMFSSCTIILDFGDNNRPATTKANNGPVIDCPEEIAAQAFEYAKKYAAADTEYGYGKQDPLRAIKIDCSGLVIMCYTYALEGTGYTLIQPDMASAYMYENAATLTDNPRHGDLIFMGDDSNDPSIFHIAIFDRFEGDQVYFIDSTSQGKINGVSERHYAKTNKKIKAYGIMKLRQ